MPTIDPLPPMPPFVPEILKCYSSCDDEDLEFVCGADGSTYNNECEAKCGKTVNLSL